MIRWRIRNEMDGVLRLLERWERRAERAQGDEERHAAAVHLRTLTEVAFTKLECVYGERILTETGAPAALHPLSHPKGQLFVAAALDLPCAAQRLIEDGGVGINAAIGHSGGTALAVACRSGSLRCVRRLIDLGADVHARDGHGYDGRRHCIVPLVAAARSGDVRVVRALLDAGVDVNAQTLVFVRPGVVVAMATALLAACLVGSVAVVELLLQQQDIEVLDGVLPVRDIASPERVTALRITESNPLLRPDEDMRRIKGLLEAWLSRPILFFAPPMRLREVRVYQVGNLNDGAEPVRPVRLARAVDEDRMVEALYECEEAVHRFGAVEVTGTDPEVERARRRLRVATARTFAALMDVHVDRVVLIPGYYETALPMSTPEGQLYYAAAKGLTSAVRDIIASGDVGVNAALSINGAGALDVAVAFGHLRCVRELMRLGASVHRRYALNQRGTGSMVGPLAAACRCESTEILRVLLGLGADPNERVEVHGFYSATPLMGAVARANVAAVRLLLDQPGIDLHAAGYTSFTEGRVSAIDLAVSNPVGRPEGASVHLLVEHPGLPMSLFDTRP